MYAAPTEEMVRLGDSLKKPNEADDPPFLTSGAYDPDHFHSDN